MLAALRALIRADAGVAALVQERCDWGLRPPGDPLPGIALQKTLDQPTVKRGGRAAWSRAMVQIDCWGRTFKDADAVATAVIDAITGFVGTVEGVKLRILPLDGGGGSDTDKDEKGPLHRVRPEFLVWYQPLPLA